MDATTSVSAPHVGELPNEHSGVPDSDYEPPVINDPTALVASGVNIYSEITDYHALNFRGLYIGDFIPSAIKLFFSNTHGMVPGSRTVFKNAVTMSCSKDVVVETMNSAYKLGLPLAWDSDLPCPIRDVHLEPSDFPVVMCYAMNSIPNLSNIYRVWQNQCIKDRCVFPFHVYRDSELETRKPSTNWTVNTVVWIVSQRRFATNIASRASKPTSQPIGDEAIAGREEYLSLSGVGVIKSDTLTILNPHERLWDNDTIIFAPSGSGKSHAVSQSNIATFGVDIEAKSLFNMQGRRRKVFIDGDQLVTWPDEPFWWRNKPQSWLHKLTRMHISQIMYCMDVLRQCNFRPIVLFNPGAKFIRSHTYRAQLSVLPYFPTTGYGRWKLADYAPECRSWGLATSIYGQMSHWAHYLNIPGRRWKHLTRHRASLIVMSMLGMEMKTTSTDDCITSIEYRTNRGWFKMNASGHVMNALIALAFPTHHPLNIIPDPCEFFSTFFRNQEVDTHSYEPTYYGTAYHSWLETYIGIIASVLAVSIIIKRIPMIKKDFLLYRHFLHWSIRHITVNARTSITTERATLRDADRRFG